MDRVDKLSAEFDLQVDYRAYYLHPEVPPGGIALKELYGGNVDYYRTALANFTRLANEVGLPVGEITVMANTKVPLMVAEVAKEQGVHDKFHRAAFHAYWAEGRNVGEWSVIESLIEVAGVRLSREDMVERFHDLAAQVDASFREGRELGVSGIPTFFIGAEAVVGAQPYEVIKAVADRNIGRDAGAFGASAIEP